MEGRVAEGTLYASVRGSHLAEMRKAAQRRGATKAILCGETYTRTCAVHSNVFYHVTVLIFFF